MKQLIIIVKPFRAEAVLSALASMNVESCIVKEAKGYSRQKNYLEKYVGTEYSMAFLPKVEICAIAKDDKIEEIVERISGIARTGRMGDGKIFVSEVSWPEPLEF